jgi:hypothetical protein
VRETHLIRDEQDDEDSGWSVPMKADVLTIPDLLADLAGKDIKVWVEQERLRCSAPEGALTPELRDQLRDRKSEIVGFLNMATATARQQPAIVPLQPRGTRTPIYAVPGHVGDVFSFKDFSKRLGEDQPFFALQPPGFDERTEPMERVEDIAAYFADQVLEFQPGGPYVIAGHCSGTGANSHVARRIGAVRRALRPASSQHLPGIVPASLLAGSRRPAPQRGSRPAVLRGATSVSR